MDGDSLLLSIGLRLSQSFDEYLLVVGIDASNLRSHTEFTTGFTVTLTLVSGFVAVRATEISSVNLYFVTNT